jgi:hypothetical protein
LRLINQQRDILEALYKRKSQPETDLDEVRQECGSFAPKVFLADWDGLLKERLVIGNPGNDSNKRVIGKGKITALGEEALKARERRAVARQTLRYRYGIPAPQRR